MVTACLLYSENYNKLQLCSFFVYVFLLAVTSVLLTINQANLTLTACQGDVIEMPLIWILFCVLYVLSWHLV